MVLEKGHGAKKPTMAPKSAGKGAMVPKRGHGVKNGAMAPKTGPWRQTRGHGAKNGTMALDGLQKESQILQ